MKRNFIVKALLLLSVLPLVPACRRGAKEPVAAVQAGPDTALSALLKPANSQVLAQIPVISGKKSSRLFVKAVQGRITFDTRKQVTLASRVSGRIEKLYIKYNYQPVKKGQLIMEVYSPELAAAQRELLLIQQNGTADGMLAASKRRLLLLGMDAAQVAKVLRTGQISYRVPVYSNESGFILEQSAAQDSPLMLRPGQYLNAGQQVFTIYRSGDLLAEFTLPPALSAHLNRKDKVLIQRMADTTQTLTANIGMVQPMLNADNPFVIARVYLKSTLLKPGELVRAQLPFFAKDSYWLPSSAVLSLGDQTVVFKKGGKVFTPIQVQTGLSQGGEIQVLEDIGGWELAKNAQFLVDSESFIKTVKIKSP